MYNVKDEDFKKLSEIPVEKLPMKFKIVLINFIIMSSLTFPLTEHSLL
jgi:hypothetical protein